MMPSNLPHPAAPGFIPTDKSPKEENLSPSQVTKNQDTSAKSQEIALSVLMSSEVILPVSPEEKRTLISAQRVPSPDSHSLEVGSLIEGVTQKIPDNKQNFPSKHKKYEQEEEKYPNFLVFAKEEEQLKGRGLENRFDREEQSEKVKDSEIGKEEPKESSFWEGIKKDPYMEDPYMEGGQSEEAWEVSEVGRNALLGDAEVNKNQVKPLKIEPIFTYELAKSEGLQKFHQALEEEFGTVVWEKVKQYVKKEGAEDIAKAKQEGKDQIIEPPSLGGIRLLVTPTGKMYALVKELGKGSFKTTFKCLLVGSTNMNLLEADLRYRAAALTSRSKKNMKKLEVLENEKKIGLYIKNQSKTQDLSNVCKLKKIFSFNDSRNQSKVGVLMELGGGDIESLLRSTTSLAERYFIVSQMAKGIEQLHEIGIVHRDLKPDNFLFFKGPDGKLASVKVTDFGLSSLLKEEERFSQSKSPFFYIDPHWHDPEMQKTLQFSKESEIYQLGVTFYQTLLGYPYKKLEEEMTVKIRERIPQPEFEDINRERDILRSKLADLEKEEEELFSQLNKILEDRIPGDLDYDGKEGQLRSAIKIIAENQKKIRLDLEAKEREEKDLNLFATRKYKNTPSAWPGMDKIEDQEVRAMLIRMLDFNPEKRPSIKEIKAFFTNKFQLQRDRDLSPPPL